MKNVINLQQKREQKGLPEYMFQFIDGQIVSLYAYNKWTMRDKFHVQHNQRHFSSFEMANIGMPIIEGV